MFVAFVTLVGGLWGAGLGAFVWYLDQAQSTIQALEDFRPKTGSKVYSADGELLGEFTTEWRQLVPLNEMPLHLQKAFVATEDDVFYEHKGVRIDAILNAALYILRTGRIRGGSTITQQLVRNVEPLDVSTRVTMGRKLREAVVALQVEREYTKDEILELYLNQIFLGGSAQGVEAAAQQYFGKSCREVTLAESAILAGVARSPNKQRPDRNPENALQRRNVVLAQMLENGFINAEDYNKAMAATLEESLVTAEKRLEKMLTGEGPPLLHRFNAPYFVEEVRKRMMAEGLASEDELFEQGLEIRTTIEMHLQRAAEKALLAALDEFDDLKLTWLKKVGRENEFVPVSGALVCLDNRPGSEGYVRALVGGRDWDKEKFNTVTQALRQPGSSIKPFVWMAALSQGRQTGITASTVFVDEPITLFDDIGRPWSPKNFDGEYRGNVTLRVALHKSVNIVSVKLVQRVGMPLVRKFLHQAGITSPIDDSHVRTIALGSPEVTVLDLCTAYSTIGKMGTYCPPSMVAEIRDRDGFSRYKHAVECRPTAITPDLAYLITYLMQGAATYGTGARSRELGRPRAGKTGTSNESRNVWFAGFTPQYTCVVWIGYRDNRPLGKGRDSKGRQFTGGALACPVWTEFMIEAHKTLPVLDYKPPEGIDFYNVAYDFRGPPFDGPGTAGGSFREAFLKGTRPPEEIPAFHESHALERLMEERLLEDVGL